MNPLQEIESRFNIAFVNQGLSKEQTLWLINRVKKIEADLRSISWGLECSACSCNCHEIARKALEEE